MKNEKIYAVIDTNVLVSALLSRIETNPLTILLAIIQGKIIPIFNRAILEEYKEVLNRPKFPFSSEEINKVLDTMYFYGELIEALPREIEDDFPDIKDKVFYQVTLNIEGSYIVTGNLKHFPKKPCVVNPAQMVEILRIKGLL